MRKERIVGFLTIGQSSREDLMPEIRDLLIPNIKVIEAGALDGLSAEEIENLAPAPDEAPIITRLKRDVSVVIGKEKITSLLQQKIDNLERDGACLIALLCTAPYRGFSSNSLILLPGSILTYFIRALDPKGSIGVLVPLEEHIEFAKNRLEKLGKNAYFESASPYGNLKDLEEAAARLSSCKGLSLILMDCLGYSLKMKQMINPFFQVPVILPRSLLARTINELLQ